MFPRIARDQAKAWQQGRDGRSLGEIGEVQKTWAIRGRPNRATTRRSRLRREIGDKTGISVTLVNLAWLIQNRGRSQEALPLLRRRCVTADTGNPVPRSEGAQQHRQRLSRHRTVRGSPDQLEQALALRETAKTPPELADTLHNLAETLSRRSGRYNQSLHAMMRALELRAEARRPPDKRGAALESLRWARSSTIRAAMARR